MRPLLLASLLASSSALGAGLASSPADESERSSLEGLYAGTGGGGQLMGYNGSNAFGYDLEARIGYSFGPAIQLYVCGALDGSSFPSGNFRSGQVAVCLQYHFLVRPTVMVYGRGGIGVSMTSNAGVSGSTTAGLAWMSGIGMEIRTGGSLFLAPEFFYRNESFNGSGQTYTSAVVGLQLSFIYY